MATGTRQEETPIVILSKYMHNLAFEKEARVAIIVFMAQFAVHYPSSWRSKLFLAINYLTLFVNVRKA